MRLSPRSSYRLDKGATAITTTTFYEGTFTLVPKDALTPATLMTTQHHRYIVFFILTWNHV